MISRRDPIGAAAHAGAAALVTLVILAPVVVPALARLIAPSDQLAPFAGNFHVYDWHPSRAVGREFRTPDGLLRHDLPNGLYYAIAPAAWAYFTPLLAPLILPGAWWAIRSRRAEPLLLLLAWAGAVYLFHVGAAYQNFRFTLAYLPPLAILAGIGAERTYRAARGLPSRVGVLYLAGGLVIMAAAGAHTLRVLVDRKDHALEVGRWASAQIPSDARLLTFGLTLTLRHYTSVETLELFELDRHAMYRLATAERPAFLLVDTLALRGQWREMSPGTNFRWLRDGPGLEPIGQSGEYTLFRVGRFARGSRPPPTRPR